MSARKLELLSPAKNVEIGIAAITAGADAVYIGGPSYGARSAAGNSIEEIATLCSFAHRFGAHVYMTVNTLLYDNEIEGVERMIGEARHAGVDGIIVQDPAVLSMSTVKDLELHCSTQMNIDTVEKARFAQELGFSQIVVPREFSLDEIKAFTSALPNMRFEVFVSGAMCVSVSGVCFISELMTDRSANRGSCAQICRLPMDLYHHDRKAAKDNPELKDELLASGHLLSMKDNLRLHELEDLVEAGASSFKIEGRLKDRDFVVNQVAAFRERLDKIIDNSNGRYERASIGVSKRTDLTKTFNRGFTSALVHGDNSDMINTKTPKSLGELMGEVIYCGSSAPANSNRNRFNDKASSRGGKFGGDKFAKGRGSSNSDKSQRFVVDMKLSRNCVLNNGDSYTFFDDNGELAGFRVNRASMLSASAASAAKLSKGQWQDKNANGLKGSTAHGSNGHGSNAFNAKGTAAAQKASGAVEGQIAAIKLADGSIEGRAGDTVRLHVQAVPEGMSVGAKLHRNVDTLFIKSINMPKSILRKTPLSCVVDIAADGLSISFMDEYERCGSASVTYASVHEELTKSNPDFDISALQPLKQEVMTSKLVKLGDDYLSLQESDITINGLESNALMPLSAFNNLRR
ncbi:peptidase U32 family protein, partial [Anaerobiospirillum succiniciproducens]|uniref:peptidase U32 family protein n=1 Tax=Anaerobiospirillum succiniciproducens TaxID=13335 RepID=UPI00248EB679